MNQPSHYLHQKEQNPVNRLFGEQRLEKKIKVTGIKMMISNFGNYNRKYGDYNISRGKHDQTTKFFSCT